MLLGKIQHIGTNLQNKEKNGIIICAKNGYKVNKMLGLGSLEIKTLESVWTGVK